jgi:hypothetical protein
VPDILLSVRRIELFSVVTRPIDITGIVAIFFPQQILAEDLSSKLDRNQPGCATCLIFASSDIWLGFEEGEFEAPEIEFATDSSLEESEFEPSVPRCAYTADSAAVV